MDSATTSQASDQRVDGSNAIEGSCTLAPLTVGNTANYVLSSDLLNLTHVPYTPSDTIAASATWHVLDSESKVKQLPLAPSGAVVTLTYSAQCTACAGFVSVKRAMWVVCEKVFVHGIAVYDVPFRTVRHPCRYEMTGVLRQGTVVRIPIVRYFF